MEEFLNSEIHRTFGPWYITIATFVFWVLVYLTYKKIAMFILDRGDKYLNRELGVKVLETCELYIDRVIFLTCIYYTILAMPVSWNKDLVFVDNIFGTLNGICIFCAIFNGLEAIKPLISQSLTKAGIEENEGLTNMIVNWSRILGLIMIICLVAQWLWDFDIIGFITSMSVLSVALAYAGKDALANIFGGIVILTEKSFKRGEWVCLNGIEGIVEEITFRSTHVRTFKQELVVVPNSLLISSPITNFSKRGKRCIEFVIGLTYDTTKEQMESFIEKVRTYLENNEKILSDDIRVHFLKYNDSSLDVAVLCYVNGDNVPAQKYLEAYNEINLALMNIMDECGVSCAFPTRSVYLENAKE